MGSTVHTILICISYKNASLREVTASHCLENLVDGNVENNNKISIEIKSN